MNWASIGDVREKVNLENVKSAKKIEKRIL